MEKQDRHVKKDRLSSNIRKLKQTCQEIQAYQEYGTTTQTCQIRQAYLEDETTKQTCQEIQGYLEDG